LQRPEFSQAVFERVAGVRTGLIAIAYALGEVAAGSTAEAPVVAESFTQRQMAGATESDVWTQHRF